MGRRVVVTGAAGPVGQRVCRRIAADPAVDEVIALDRRKPRHQPDNVVWRQVELLTSPLDELLAGSDTVCHLAGVDPLDETDPSVDVRKAERLLSAASASGVSTFVLRSTATVYGAWDDNPVPLTEAAPLRPNPDAKWVRTRVAIEELVEAWADEHVEARVSVLRPCVTVSEAGPDQLGRALAASRVIAPEGDPPVQFVHADDVAAAIDLVRRQGSHGLFNVAPEGALDADEVRALVGGAPRIRLPDGAARVVSRTGWRYGVAPTPPHLEPYVTAPWVVASGALRAEGWEPEFTNAEAFVAAHGAAPWATISPQRRQELALGVAGTALVAGVAGGVALVRRLRRR